MEASELSDLLWHERRLREALVYRLEIQRMLLRSGDDKWLELAAKDVAAAFDDVRAARLLRDVALSGLAQEWNQPDDSNLRDLADKAPGPWSEIFTGHLRALEAEEARADTLAAENDPLLNAVQPSNRYAKEWLEAEARGGKEDA